MTQEPKIKLYHCSVYHKRFFPSNNGFHYKVFYLGLPLPMSTQKSQIQGLTINQQDWISFHQKDHGYCDNRSLNSFIQAILDKQGISEKIHALELIAMPRVLGYGFNPVSFWLGRDDQQRIIMILAEVHNTFGEKHSYLCCHKDHRPFNDDDLFFSHKCFHVSPFLPRKGYYRFNFLIRESLFSVKIDYFNENGRHQLTTALTGRSEELSRSKLRLAFWQYPWVTLKSITMIHYQALRLWLKKTPFFPLPKQETSTLTLTQQSIPCAKQDITSKK